MKISYNFDDKEYYELIWLYERFAEQRKKENDEKTIPTGNVSLNNMM